ncbi:hypothetical protein O3P69_002640 [Scylla paramamosain]|uniref:Uncharacterized protein n=1 Tax=Scylla paramamosain TaxID=85552 RepID=A0AAW0ULJ3_SCYPA
MNVEEAARQVTVLTLTQNLGLETLPWVALLTRRSPRLHHHSDPGDRGRCSLPRLCLGPLRTRLFTAAVFLQLLLVLLLPPDLDFMAFSGLATLSKLDNGIKLSSDNKAYVTQVLRPGIGHSSQALGIGPPAAPLAGRDPQASLSSKRTMDDMNTSEEAQCPANKSSRVTEKCKHPEASCKFSSFLVTLYPVGVDSTLSKELPGVFNASRSHQNVSTAAFSSPQVRALRRFVDELKNRCASLELRL